MIALLCLLALVDGFFPTFSPAFPSNTSLLLTPLASSRWLLCDVTCIQIGAIDPSAFIDQHSLLFYREPVTPIPAVWAVWIIIYQTQDCSEKDCAENNPGGCVSGSITGEVSSTTKIWHSYIIISFLLVSRLFPR